MSIEEEMRAAQATFVVEARELLESMEAGLLGLEVEDDPTETINAVFRAAHTIKGSAGLFGLSHIVRFTHELETLLDRLRYGELEVSSELVGVLLPCQDHLGRLLDGIAQGVLEPAPELTAVEGGLLAQLRPFLEGASAAGSGAGSSAAAALAVPAVEGPRLMHLSLRFGADCLRSGMDPLSFIRYLSGMAEIVALATVADLMPEAASMDAETLYLDFEVSISTEASVTEIESVFEFVREESQIRVLDVTEGPDAVREFLEQSGDLAGRIEHFLLTHGLISADDLATVHEQAAAQDRPEDPTTGEPVDRRQGERRGGGAEVPEQRRPQDNRSREARSIRIDASRLDRLIDVVGEMVIAGASAGLRASHNKDEGLTGAIGELMRLVEEVRDSALQLRMVPIGTTFSRFQRVVRDVGADLGKDVQLVISGGETEVDKALVEQIADPLTHLVRNSMDHGIESAAVRAERGKSARGTLRLNAFHDSGSIVIEVGDDGGGIDRDRVLTKAIERGLVDPLARPSDQEIYQMIFEPGFSTADKVSDLSGRGVGMDVVKRNITSLRGSVEVDSRLGEGCTMRIRLPLTLAIIDGFLIGVGGSSFVVPLDRVVECVELPQVASNRECMDLRGEVLPFVRLRTLFGIRDDKPRRENVVVVEHAGMKTGLVVDQLVGEFQTVIKPLGRLFEHVHGVGGSTILGNGEVALIIDVPTLVQGLTEPNLTQLAAVRD